MRRSALVGALASAGLVAFYVTVLTLVSGWEFTRGQATRDWPYLVAIVPLFGAQVGLYHLLRVGAARAKAAGAAAGASGGASGTAMIACCVHLLPMVLPYTGVVAFATVVTAWRVPMLLLAIAANLVGIGVAVRALRINRQHDAMLRSQGARL